MGMPIMNSLDSVIDASTRPISIVNRSIDILYINIYGLKQWTSRVIRLSHDIICCNECSLEYKGLKKRCCYLIVMYLYCGGQQSQQASKQANTRDIESANSLAIRIERKVHKRVSTSTFSCICQTISRL